MYDSSSGNLTGQIYQVGNLTTDSLFWGRPEDITMARPYYIASADAMSDLGRALQLCCICRITPFLLVSWTAWHTKSISSMTPQLEVSDQVILQSQSRLTVHVWHTV